MRRFCLPLVLVCVPGFTFADEDKDKDKPILVLNAGGHTAPIKNLVFTPDGKELISYSLDKTIRIWDVKTGEMLKVLRLPVSAEDRAGPHGGSHGAALHANGKNLAVAARALSADQHWIYMINLAEGKVVRVLRGHTLPILALARSHDNKWLASCGEMGELRLWDLTTGQTKYTLQGHTGEVRAVAFSPDGSQLASAGADRSVRLWSVATGRMEGERKGHADIVRSLAWSPDGKTLAGSTEEGVYLWNPDGGLRVKEKRSGLGEGLSFSADSRLLLAGRFVLDTTSGKERVALGAAKHTGRSEAAALSPDGHSAAWGGLHGEELILWDATAKRTREVEVRRLGGKGRSITDVAWSPDGKTLAWQYLETTAAVGERTGWGRSFDFSKLHLGPAPATPFHHAQHEAGGLSSEGPVEHRMPIRRGRETVSVIKLPAGKGAVNSWTFLGSKYVVATRPAGLFLFATEDGHEVRAFKGAGAQRAVAPEPGNRYVVTGGLDQVLRVYTPDRAEPLVSLFVAGDDWIAWTPEGYYAASPGGERLMGWQINQRPGQLCTFHPANQFRRSLYRPEVIRQILATANLHDAVAKADAKKGKKGKQVVLDDVRPPRVWIVSPEQNLAATEPKVLIKAAAESTGTHPVTSLQLLLNGRPYEGQRGVRAVPAANPGKAEREWTVTLTPGTHHLAVLARSDVSSAISSAVEVTYTPPQTPAPKDNRPGLYVLAIGINKYVGDLKLDCAVNDAGGISTTLQDKSKPLFRVETRVIKDEQATRAGILQGLAWLKERMKPHDVALIFYAGHGHNDENGRFYMLSVDMDVDDLDKTTVTGDELKKHLAELPGRVVLLLDACHSGAKGNNSLIGRQSTSSSLTDDLVRDLVDDDCGVIVMCAAMGKEESHEDAAVKHGYFTLAVIEGLSGKADYDKDGLILLTELDLYVDNRVRELSRDEQHPVMAKPTTVRSFALAKP